MHSPSLAPAPSRTAALARSWRAWWRSLSPTRQDRFAALAPLAAVLLFMAAIVAAFWYLRMEEGEREQEALRRDVEYAQQRVRLRLLERQEQIMRIARDLSNQELERPQFDQRAEALISQYPELQAITWIDARGHIRASHAAPTLSGGQMRVPGEVLKKGDTADAFDLTRDLQQPVYVQPAAGSGEPTPLLQLQVPLNVQGKFGGVVLGEYSIDSLLRYGTPTEVLARYAVTLLDAQHQVLAGTPLAPRSATMPWQPWSKRANEYEVPVSPVGNGLVLRAQAYRTSLGVVGSGLFWLVVTLSTMTAWMLIATWRHTRRRMQAQMALVAETNFRRAMENSVLTGMRALDLQGRITYVNAAFCQMTGWSEAELVGQTPPFPYWPDADLDTLHARLQDELNGKTVSGGFQVRVRRKNGAIFDARLYVSPLIDARGQQTGWMTSMTDITEPNRIREQLSASHERFTIVLEALDASVSVAPLGSEELLFANKLYRQWFGSQTDGHLQLVAQAGVLPAKNAGSDSADGEDGLMGLPTDTLTSAHTENAEIFLPELGKWLEVRSRYLSWVDGRLAQMVIATDITPRRQAEEQTARQTERAQSVSRLITMGEMASSVAHELNQPLTAINNYCNGIVSRIHSGQITQEALLAALEKTSHQAQRAGQIIQRIRDFVKKSEPNRTLADVSSMVGEALELADIELRRHNVRLTHYVAARLPQVMADSILIEQVLINLMKNGAESIAQARRTPARRSVELRVVPKQIEGQQVVEFSVQDTGQGLAQEVLERLFEAFFSTKQEGMGMGLNLCRSIVESHQGRMQAENIYNGSEVTGCRFSFWLPLAAPDNDATNSVANVHPPRTIA
ncbi:PAS domain-containing sensor histidine kinase [Acidovorax sp. SRB_14]|uniref:PAS domain S-box protein n=1 Tax=unclassified Acidovorax TaxID=2684926 RepID=UPI00145E2A64|nr:MULTISPECIES: PAS domain S-box protein [unclassified Acidovorax]NMM84651.1 PAS domain-containing sensor histidine kinase [Rhodococcus sp. SRB_17]NMM76577.1 PAS domain-containing sensor histidine kinase [Acidovorax sp. SRB_24]NMM78365.1 PAS domain-containing sensor histidine kinase [Acidovorax sp. SRB_24]NMM78384.1 PAS domain-containing sensor histidine kinase [Acidovorax sp. SRB_24]NMM79399.1 PAS domain-containing sensor histidine kinase [Acidovorax sp. SRB_14]